MRAVSLAGLCLIITPVLAQLPENLKRQFDEAEKRIVRLPPAAFRELPANVVRELQRRGCKIPQTPYTAKPHNVIRGEFAKRGQTDWAVLCSVNQTHWLDSFWTAPRYVSTILVFWGGSEKNAAEIAPQEDRSYLQGISATEIGFSRGIAPAGKNFIAQHNPGASLPAIDHYGIDDSFIEKGSETWYFHNGKWMRLLGAD